MESFIDYASTRDEFEESTLFSFDYLDNMKEYDCEIQLENVIIEGLSKEEIRFKFYVDRNNDKKVVLRTFRMKNIFVVPNTYTVLSKSNWLVDFLIKYTCKRVL